MFIRGVSLLLFTFKQKKWPLVGKKVTQECRRKYMESDLPIRTGSSIFQSWPSYAFWRPLLMDTSDIINEYGQLNIIYIYNFILYEWSFIFPQVSQETSQTIFFQKKKSTQFCLNNIEKKITQLINFIDFYRYFSKYITFNSF